MLYLCKGRVVYSVLSDNVLIYSRIYACVVKTMFGYCGVGNELQIQTFIYLLIQYFLCLFITLEVISHTAKADVTQQFIPFSTPPISYAGRGFWEAIW